MPNPIRVDIKDMELYIEEAKKNIQNDRALIDTILVPLMQVILKEPTRQDLIESASKLIDNLQRSNLQLVKLISVLNTKRSISKQSKEDYEGIFDQIQKEEEEE